MLNGLKSVYEKMLRIRLAESLIAQHYFENRIFSFVHFCVGQEFAPSLLGSFAKSNDHFFGNHRSHGHFIAKGGSVEAMFSEMLGKETGSSKGYGGSMHMFDPAVGFIGSSPILSSNLPIALGDAYGQKESGSGGLTVVFTGDGATEEGNYYETLNAAALWEVPLVIVIENNRYSVNSPLSKRRPASFSHENLANSFGVRFERIQETDVLGDLQKISETLDYVREKSRPVVVMADSFRHMAHSAPIFDDKMQYREEDIAHIRETGDVLEVVKNALLDGGVQVALLSSLEDEIKHEVREALKAALEAPEAGVVRKIGKESC